MIASTAAIVKALVVDFGSVPAEPATNPPNNGPIIWPNEAEKV